MPEPTMYQAQASAAAVSEIPASCTCTWSWGPPGWRWVRTGAKEDCPWHSPGDRLMAELGVKAP